MSMLVFCTSGRELESIAWPPWNGLIPSENAPRRVVAALRRNVSSELEKAPQIVNCHWGNSYGPVTKPAAS